MFKRVSPAIVLSLACASCVQALSDSADSGGNVGFGGAQDIGQFRDIIERGQIPGPETFDAGGFFAEHHVELPNPACGQPLCATPMLARGTDWLTRKPQTTLQVGVTTTIDPGTLPRRPLDLVVVVDRSGSMSSDGRLLKVQDGLRLLVEQLRAEDRLAMVSFDDQVSVIAPWGATKSRLLAAIDGLSPRGATNLHGGLRAGLELAASVESPERQARVLFLSDGLATAGNTSRADILALAGEYAARGIGVSTIGVGLEFDPQVMRGVAERGAGNFYFVEDAEAVHEVFTEELKVSMTPIALDVRFDVRFSPKYQLRDVAGRSGWVALGNGGTLSIPAAFATSRDGAPPTGGRRGGGGVLFFDLGETLAQGDGQVATVELSYRLPGSTTRQTQRLAVSEIAPAGSDAPRPTVDHPAMQKLSAMYNLYRGIRTVTLQAKWEGHCAIETVARTGRGADRWNAVEEDADISADRVLLTKLEDNLRRYGFVERSQGSETYDTTCAPLRQPAAPIDYGNDSYDDHHHACSSTGGTVALWPLLLAALAIWRRRAPRSPRARS